ncbi:MAG: MerR family transcriptional regulator [Lactobacillaceae bacterium]
MKTYHIKEVSEMLGISSYTLRYYEKIGLLSFVKRDDNGVREFLPKDLVTIKTIECLKKTNLPLKDIKNYFKLVDQGLDTAKERRELFVKQKQKVNKEIEELEKTLKMINYKLHYYDEVLKTGDLNSCDEERQELIADIIAGNEK